MASSKSLHNNPFAGGLKKNRTDRIQAKQSGTSK
jgi:hypothetical protein